MTWKPRNSGLSLWSRSESKNWRIKSGAVACKSHRHQISIIRYGQHLERSVDCLPCLPWINIIGTYHTMSYFWCLGRLEPSWRSNMDWRLPLLLNLEMQFLDRPWPELHPWHSLIFQNPFSQFGNDKLLHLPLPLASWSSVALRIHRRVLMPLFWPVESTTGVSMEWLFLQLSLQYFQLPSSIIWATRGNTRRIGLISPNGRKSSSRQ